LDVGQGRRDNNVMMRGEQRRVEVRGEKDVGNNKVMVRGGERGEERTGEDRRGLRRRWRIRKS